MITVIGKLTDSTPFAQSMMGFLKAFASRENAFYVHFVKSVVTPNAALFSYLVMTGELIAGIGLLTGAFTRISACIAMVMFLNYMFAKGAWFWSPNSQDAAVFFIALAVFISRAGRVWGVDYFLERRKHI
ncbi:hypothetical protein WSM22_19320 [Cytophagales bacterium WSM2-2]|nr:hypothetical protein WSM22_19320 [Cytophagales bacterium WSM2-2]